MNDTGVSLNRAILGQTGRLYYLHSAEETAEAATLLTGQCRRNLKILSFDLDPAIYDQYDYIEALKQLALQSRVAQVRILLQNNSLIRQQPHRLVDLARRLTSTIEIRKPSDEFEQRPENFLLADDSGYLQRNVSAPNSAVSCCFNDPLQVSHLAGLFDEAWENAEPEREALKLHL